MTAPHPSTRTLTVFRTLDEARERRAMLGRELQSLQAEIAAARGDDVRREHLKAAHAELVAQMQGAKRWIATRCSETDWHLLSRAYKVMIPEAESTCAEVDGLLDLIEERLPRDMLGGAYEERRETMARLEDVEREAEVMAFLDAQLERADEARFAERCAPLRAAAARGYALLCGLYDDTGKIPLCTDDIDAVLDEIEKHVPEAELDEALRAHGIEPVPATRVEA